MSSHEPDELPQRLRCATWAFLAAAVKEAGVIIDCDSCEVRGLACGDCVVTALLGAPPGGVVLDDDEREALDVLAGSGLVPPLRLVVALDPPPDTDAGGGATTVAAG